MVCFRWSLWWGQVVQWLRIPASCSKVSQNVSYIFHNSAVCCGWQPRHWISLHVCLLQSLWWMLVTAGYSGVVAPFSWYKLGICIYILFAPKQHQWLVNVILAAVWNDYRQPQNLFVVIISIMCVTVHVWHWTIFVHFISPYVQHNSKMDGCIKTELVVQLVA